MELDILIASYLLRQSDTNVQVLKNKLFYPVLLTLNFTLPKL